MASPLRTAPLTRRPRAVDGPGRSAADAGALHRRGSRRGPAAARGRPRRRAGRHGGERRGRRDPAGVERRRGAAIARSPTRRHHDLDDRPAPGNGAAQLPGPGRHRTPRGPGRPTTTGLREPDLRTDLPGHQPSRPPAMVLEHRLRGRRTRVGLPPATGWWPRAGPSGRRVTPGRSRPVLRRRWGPAGPRGGATAGPGRTASPPRPGRTPRPCRSGPAASAAAGSG